jgi:hypothetical protein
MTARSGGSPATAIQSGHGPVLVRVASAPRTTCACSMLHATTRTPGHAAGCPIGTPVARPVFRPRLMVRSPSADSFDRPNQVEILACPKDDNPVKPPVAPKVDCRCAAARRIGSHLDGQHSRSQYGRLKNPTTSWSRALEARAVRTSLRAVPERPGVGIAYRHVASGLRQAIAAGRYPAGQRLPTEAELVAATGLSRQTARC